MKILLTCNIRYLDSEKFIEWDEPSTIKAIKIAIESLKYDVEVLDCNCNPNDIKSKILKYNPDLVFNIAEGMKGEDRESLVPSILEDLKIPFTGSSSKTLRNCLNKSNAKEILKKSNINTPLWYITDSPLRELPDFLKYPVIIKPLLEGSSKGIKNNSLVIKEEDLYNITNEIIKEYNQSIIIEEFLTGREFTVAILGNNEDIEILPIVEIDFSSLPKGSNPLYGYEAKWIWDTRENPLKIFTCPALIDENLENDIKETVKNTYNVLNCLDWARIDVRLDSEGKVNIIEVNPLPGIIPDKEANSCFPKASRVKGYDYKDIIKKGY